MSQIYKPLTSSGPIPPIIPTQFTADDATVGVSVNNNFNLLSNDTIANNNNGIQTTTIADGSANHYTQLTNRISVTATTSDGAGQTQTVTLMTPTNATALEFSSSIIGYDSINDEACGGSQEGICRKSSGTTTIVGTNDSLDEADAGLVAVDWNIIGSGGDLAVEFIGVAGRTIVWRCTFTYIQTP